MPAIDRFHPDSLEIVASIEDAYVVTPSDTVDLQYLTRSVYVGVAGDLKVTLKSGNDITYTNAHIGRHFIRASRIWATGTTATGIVAED